MAAPSSASADIGVARKFDSRNINPIAPVKFFVHLDLDQISLFLDGHYLSLN